MQLSSVSNFSALNVPLDQFHGLIAGSKGETASEALALQPVLAKTRVAPVRSAMHFLHSANRHQFGGSLGIETVIMDDGRKREKQTSIPPWRMICALSITGANGIRAVGTGWLIGPRILVTAGHCVHHQDLGGWAKRIEISAGRDANEFPYGTVVATRFSALQEWTEKHTPELDFGCIHLNESLGDQTGWFSLKSVTDAELKDETVTIAGYPADRGQGTELYQHTQKILRVDPQRLYYDVDTFGGQSGSPAWLDATPCATPVVVGIHAYGVAGTPAAHNIVANSATRLIPPVLAEIARWRAQSDAA